jgi:hypothetical protein
MNCDRNYYSIFYKFNTFPNLNKINQNMKKITSLLFLCLLVFTTTLSMAQAPEGFSYQAIARNNAGALLANKSINVKATILSGASASNPVYTETHSVTTTAYGQFSIVIGQGTTSGNFSTIAWNADPHHVKVELDNGAGYVAMGTVQLQSVPYALHSKTSDKAAVAESVTNLNVSTSDISDINSSGAANGQVLKWNGSAWVPDTDLNITYDAGNGISLTGTTFSANSTSALWNANKLQGKDVDAATPATNQILKWNGTKWALSTLSSGGTSYFAGNGLTLSNDSFIAQNSTAMWNANKILNVPVGGTAPSTNQVLQYNGSQLQFATLSSGGGSSTTRWDSVGTDDITFSGGNVGINVDPLTRFHVEDSFTSTSAGTFIMAEKYFHGGTSTGSRYISDRAILIGHSGFSNVATLNGVGGDATTSTGENIATWSDVNATGAYNTASLSQSTGGTGQNMGTYSSARGTASFNVGLFANANQSNSNTNYGVFSRGDSAATNYAGYFVGDVNYTGTLTNVSDRKLKYNINTLNDATTIVNQLSPKTYYYKQDGDAGELNLSEGLQYGFVAQELELVLPDLVKNQVHMKGLKSTESIEYKAVNYMALIPVLTQAIKEQNERIVLLEKRLLELEANDK